MNTFVIKLKKQTKKQNIHWPLSWQEHRGCHTYSFHYFSTVHNVQLNFKQLVNFLLLCWRWSHESNPVVLEQRHWKLLLWHLKLFFSPAGSPMSMLLYRLRYLWSTVLPSGFAACCICTLLLWWNRIPVIHAKRLLVCYYLVFICNFSTWKMLMCNMNFGCKVYHGI